MTLERVELQLRRGDVDAVLLFADPERAVVEAGRLMVSDPAVRKEFRGDAKVLAAQLRSLAGPHVARARRRAELGAEADIERRAAVARLASGDTPEWGDSSRIASVVNVGPRFMADSRGRSALDRAGVRRRSGVDGQEWNVDDARAACSRLGGVGLLRDAFGGEVETWV